MNKLRLRLMYKEGLQRLRDAETLSEAMALGEQSDSPYLLSLLGLELLLKFVFEAVLCKPGRGHEYEKLFNELPSDIQARLLCLAGERVGWLSCGIAPCGRRGGDLTKQFYAYYGFQESPQHPMTLMLRLNTLQA